MIDLAEHYSEGPVSIGSIAERQGISVKYLEQIIVLLKKAGFIKSVRGPKGGHMLATPPEEIKMGEVLAALEDGLDVSGCVHDPEACDRAEDCKARDLWEVATSAMYNELNSLKLSEMIQ